MRSINPATGQVIAEYAPHDAEHIRFRLARAQEAFAAWRERSFAERAMPMRALAALLRERKHALALLVTREMGKLLGESVAEIEKCAEACEYYAEHAATLLADAALAGGGCESFVSHQPLGVILAVMPWNFPFWQVLRFAAPHLMAGNVGLLKHASNVTGSALALETLCREAGFPAGVFTTLLLPGGAVAALVADPIIKAVTLTGSTEAGKSVAEAAGRHVKKTVLELGGSDPYVVLEDADIALAARECAKSRLINAGQSCIAAKRFIIHRAVKAEFLQHFTAHFAALTVGSPEEAATTLAPLARDDLAETLHAQLAASLREGAREVFRSTVPPHARPAFFPAVILDDVRPGMTAFDEELFGPIAAIITAKEEDEAFAFANASRFGLGSAIFTRDVARGRMLARTRIEAGQCFVNALVRSDPRLPFGGCKESGYGRELAAQGIREFTNAKTVFIA